MSATVELCICNHSAVQILVMDQGSQSNAGAVAVGSGEEVVVTSFPTPKVPRKLNYSLTSTDGSYKGVFSVVVGPQAFDVTSNLFSGYYETRGKAARRYTLLFPRPSSAEGAAGSAGLLGSMGNSVFFSLVGGAEVAPKTFSPYVFPEKGHMTSGKQDVAFCFSGGGCRAYAAAWGQFRALKGLDLFKHIGYFSCVSGGSWACGALMYRDAAKFDDNTFLGSSRFAAQKKSPISLFQMALLKQTQMGFPAVRDFTQILWAAQAFVFSWFNWEQLWNASIARRFLGAFGVPTQRIMGWTKETTREAVLRNPSPGKEAYHPMAQEHHPYLVVSSLLLGPRNFPLFRAGWTQSVQVFESTPLYCGIPSRESVSTYQLNGKDVQIPVAGGCVEPAGFNGKEKKNGVVSVKAPYTFTDVFGTSSTAFAGALALSSILSFALPHFKYDPSIQSVPKNQYHGEDWVFGDAGLFDNFGLLSILRRKVKNIIVCINTETDISPDLKEEDLEKDNVNATALGDKIDSVLLGYFGHCGNFGASGSSLGLKCFDRSGLWPVVDQLQKAIDNHHPVVAQSDDIQVLDNPQHGVWAYKANITWVYLDKLDATQHKAGDRTKGFNSWMDDPLYNKYLQGSFFLNFPNYPTMLPFTAATKKFYFSVLGYTKGQVNLLSEYTDWTLYTWFTTTAQGATVLKRIKELDSWSSSAPSPAPPASGPGQKVPSNYCTTM